MSRVLLLVALVCSGIRAQTGARYLIITADSLEPSIRPLAEWHHFRGLPTRITRLSAIGRDTTAIRNYIRNAWNTWNPRPEFVLLVGSAESLPARLYLSGGSVVVSSDNIYADVTGDLRAELAVGRLPAKSRLQLDEMVIKTLAYERTPDTLNRRWTSHLTTVVHDRNDDDSLVYWADARHAAARSAAAGFAGCDSFASTRGDSADDVIAAIDSGTSLVLYRGRATGNWYQPFRVLPQRTTNGSRCPVVLSVTCATMTLTPGESMVGEAWIRTGTVSTIRGAVAFFGNTHSDIAVATVRSSVARGFFDSLFLGNHWQLGHAARMARAALLAEFPDHVNDYLGFNLYGDPALGIWTAPPAKPLVTRPASLSPGLQTVTINVRTGSLPVANALVCLSMDSTLYASGLTDAGGNARLTFNPVNTGSARLIVTGRNLYPFDTIIPVVPVAVTASPTSPYQPQLCLPFAFNNSLTIRLLRPLVGGGTIQLCDPLGRTICRVVIAPTAGSATIKSAALPAGVYRCLLTDKHGRLLDSRTVRKIR